MDALQSLMERPDLSEDLRPLLQRMCSQHDKRLWHQLTNTIQDLFKLPSSKPFQVDLYSRFISTFADQLDQIKLVQIASNASQQLPNAQEAFDFLQPIVLAVDKANTQDAYILVTMESAHHQLLLGNVDAVQEAIRKSGALLDILDNVKPAVHASFYKMSADYHKAKAEYSDFYATCLLFMACIDVERDLTLPERVSRAHDLGLAALLGTTTYNFGKLLLHPILTALIGTEFEWIRSLLYAFNAGSIDKFEKFLAHFHSEPLLQESYAFLRQKICLMALIESIFARPAGHRVVSFESIAIDTALPEDEVEHLLMKAMSCVLCIPQHATKTVHVCGSLKLIKGHIDQVNRISIVHWVQPRVLDDVQTGKLDSQLSVWSRQVQRTGDYAFRQAPEIFAIA